MVRTGSHGYLKYGFEGSTYAGSATVNKKFGLQDRLTTLTLTNNRINLPALNKNTIDQFAYGQQQGTASVGFVLSNPWIFGAVLGAPSTTGSSNPYTHTYPHASNGLNKEPRTVQIEVGLDGASADIVRTLKGGIVNSLNISASVGGIIECTTDVTYGKETAPSTSLGTAPVKPASEFPYTFAHAELTVGGATVVQCQEASINFTQNTELLYGLNSHAAVSSYRRVLDMTGSFKASLINKSLLEKVLEQVKAGTSSGTYSETIGGSPEFRLTFIKDNTNEKITITGSGLAITDHSVSGFEPVEPIFEEINWQFKTVTIAALNSESAEE